MTVNNATVELESVVEDSAVVMVTEEEQEHMRDEATAVRIDDVCEGDVDNTACRYSSMMQTCRLETVEAILSAWSLLVES